MMSFIPAWAWRWIAIAGVALAFGAWVGIRVHARDQVRYNALQLEYSDFRSKTAAAGQLAQLQAQKQVAANQAAKEKADEDNQTQLAALHKSIDELRKQRDSARRSLVPATASSAQSPDRACFDRTKLESAIRQYRDSIRGLVDQGSEAIIGLNSAKTWARNLQR